MDASIYASEISGSKFIGGGLDVKHDNGAAGSLDVNHQLGAGTKLDLGTSVPLHSSADSQLKANVYGSHVKDGPFKAQSVGGGVQYNHANGMFANVDATHQRRVGNSYSANVGRGFDAGPGTLFVGVGATKNPWSPRVDKSVGINYRAQF